MHIFIFFLHPFADGTHKKKKEKEGLEFKMEGLDFMQFALHFQWYEILEKNTLKCLK